ncbi:MAG: hemolysin family protein [Gemmatimonadales bacterium]
MTLVVAFFGLVAALAAALCALADGAVLSIDEDEPPASVAVRALLARREKAHRALAFGRILSQLLAGAAAAAALKASGVPPQQVAPLVLVAGILVVVITESAARTAGDALGASAVERAAPVIAAVENLLRPVVTFGTWCDALLLRLLPPPVPGEIEREASLEQFREVVTSEAEVARDEAGLLRGVFSLGDTEVRAIMVPRVDIVGVEQDTAWADVVRMVRQARHSRLLVFDGTLDEVVGILYAKDLLPALIAGLEPASGWLSLVRPATFIPGTKSVDLQLRDFKTMHRHIAIVVDEYGGTAGLVTLEDALELIVGEIRDENDVEEPDVIRGDDGGFRLSARVTLGELTDLTGQDFTRDDVQTLGGLVYELVGRVPRQGESLVVGNYRLTVDRVVRRRLERISVQRLHEIPEGVA